MGRFYFLGKRVKLIKSEASKLSSLDSVEGNIIMLLKSFIPHWKNIYLFLFDKHSDWKPKALLIVAVAYLLWPVDLVPDLIPVLGWLDDLGMGTVATWYLLRTAKKYETTKTWK